MHDIIVFFLIVSWIIGTVMKARKGSKSDTSGPPPTPTAGRPAVTPRVRKQTLQVPQATGYAGRGLAPAVADPTRAMDSAAPRLAEGAEYASIVADRAADRAAEQRFADEVKQLVKSEPKAQRKQQTDTPSQPTSAPGFPIKQPASAGLQASVINGIILAEALAPPLSKRANRRQLRA